MAKLVCPACGTGVHGDFLLPAPARLGSEDQQFALAFILRSGSLKEMAKLYGVSYPTVRNRLDELIARLGANVEALAKEAADDPPGVDAAGGGSDSDASGDG